MPMGDLLSRVLGSYDLVISGIRQENLKAKKGVWFIDTDQGLLVLKKMPVDSVERLRFLLAAVRHLQERGIKIPPLVPTRSGEAYVMADGFYFIVSQAVRGFPPHYERERELAAMVKALAAFHKASIGFVAPPGSKERSHLGKWPESYAGQAVALAEMAGSARLGDFWQKAGPYLRIFRDRCLQLREELLQSGYWSWVEKVRQGGGLCHQDFAAGNLVIDACGEINVLDIDSLTMDIPARDLRKVMNKVMKKRGSFDADLGARMLDWYCQVNPLSRDELNVVRIDLEFPHIFCGLVGKYHQGRGEDWSEGKFLRKLEEIIAYESSKHAGLRKALGR